MPQISATPSNHRNRSGRPSAAGQGEYRLRVEQSPADGPRIRAEDRTSGRTLLEWRGALARHLLQSGALPLSALETADFACDKSLIRHLTLTGAAAQLALDQMAELDAAESAPRRMPRLRPVQLIADLSPDERLAERLAEAGRRLPSAHLLVARTLFSKQGEHLAESDVVCLLSLDYPSMRVSLIHACLDDLTAWRVIQRIVIDEETVFYDVDMRPHLHVFDPARRELRDAPDSGVLSVGASK